MEPNEQNATTPSMTNGITDAVGGEVEDALVEDELLVEEISIDGMCGVY